VRLLVGIDEPFWCHIGRQYGANGSQHAPGEHRLEERMMASRHDVLRCDFVLLTRLRRKPCDELSFF
jgi:hypothetical protein